MGLGGLPAPGTAKRVIGRHVLEATGWFGLQITVAASTRSVLVVPGDGGIDADIPHDHAGCIGKRLRR
jgi:hypothetical protein